MPQTFDPAPSRLEAVLDRAWLTGILSGRWPGAEVVDFTVVETLVTMATKVRLALEVRGGDADLPRNICIKGVLQETGAPRSTSVIETRFYRDFAGGLDLRVPSCIHAALNEAGDNGVIVMQDVIVERQATFLSALEPFTPDEARESLEQLAILNAGTWRGTPLFEGGGVLSFLGQVGPHPMPLETLQGLLDGERGVPLAPEIRSAVRLQKALGLYIARVDGQPTCLVHGDAHAGNIYRTPAGYGLVDWQILQKGEWAQDVAYHLAAVLSPEDRRVHERALLEHYLERLAALGGPRIAAEQAWTQYRAAMIYGYFLWAITRKVKPEITHEFVRRLGLAVMDLDSFALVGA